MVIRAATVNAESSGSALSAIDSFNSGNTLFLIERVDTMKALSQSVDWGVLPMPKYSEEQEKYIQELIEGKEYLERHSEEQEKYIDYITNIAKSLQVFLKNL